MLRLRKGIKRRYTMIVQIKDKNIDDSYDIVHYANAYATIAVNPYMPIRHHYLHFALHQAARTKITACNAEHEITVDQDNNLLLIKSHREYRVVVENSENMPETTQKYRTYDEIKDDALQNVTQAALWVATNSSYFKLADVNVEVNSDNLVIVVSLNTSNARVIVDENEVLENYH